VSCGDSRPVPTERSTRCANAAFAWECEARRACIRPPPRAVHLTARTLQTGSRSQAFVPIKYANRFFARPTQRDTECLPDWCAAAPGSRAIISRVACHRSEFELFTPRHAIDFRQISHELGVRYILHGSARRADNRIRGRGQIDRPTTLAHVWTGHYHCDLTETSVVRHEITRAVSAAIAPAVILFGPVSLRLDGQNICLRSLKARAALAYIALTESFSETRHRLIRLFWSDASEEQAGMRFM